MSTPSKTPITKRGTWTATDNCGQKCKVVNVGLAENLELALNEARDALELAQAALANSVPVSENTGPKPLPVIAKALAAIDAAMKEAR